MSAAPGLIYVLHEDQRGPRKAFGLHELVLSCVVDRLGLDRWTLGRRLLARPMKGVDKLLHEVCWSKEEFEALIASSARVFALIDDDRVRRHTGLPAGAPGADVVATILARCPEPASLVVVLLEQNTETILQAVGDCARSLGKNRYGDVEQATEKNVEARDAVLNRAAFDDAALRACIQARVPSFAVLIEGIASLL